MAKKAAYLGDRGARMNLNKLQIGDTVWLKNQKTGQIDPARVSGIEGSAESGEIERIQITRPNPNGGSQMTHWVYPARIVGWARHQRGER